MPEHCSKENWRTKMKPRKTTNDLREQVLRQVLHAQEGYFPNNA